MQTFTKNDFMSVAIFNSLNTEFRELSVLRGVTVPQITSVNNNLLPNANVINTIERNIDILAAAQPPVAVPATKTWFGGTDDEKWLDYNDVNRWFESLALIRGI